VEHESCAAREIVNIAAHAMVSLIWIAAAQEADQAVVRPAGVRALELHVGAAVASVMRQSDPHPTKKPK
jgi:hypothetical protein